MLAQSNSEFLQFLEMLDGDLLGAVLIIGTIGFFISFIVVVASVSKTWNNIAISRMNQNLIQDLLAKGYSVEDIERLAYGGPSWNRKFHKLFKSAKSQFASHVRRRRYENQPVPPMKQTA